MKFFKFGLLAMAALGLMSACSKGSGGGGGPSVNAAQIQGHWQQIYLKANSTEISADASGYMPYPTDTGVTRMFFLVTIDGQKTHLVMINDSGVTLQSTDQDYHLDGDSIVTKDSSGKEDRAKPTFEGSNLVVNDQDGSISKFKKITDAEFAAKQQPPPPAASAPADNSVVLNLPALTDGNAQPLSPEELKQLGLPPGTVVEQTAPSSVDVQSGSQEPAPKAVKRKSKKGKPVQTQPSN